MSLKRCAGGASKTRALVTLEATRRASTTSRSRQPLGRASVVGLADDVGTRQRLKPVWGLRRFLPQASIPTPLLLRAAPSRRQRQQEAL